MLPILILILSIIILTYFHFKQKHSYWKNRNVPFIPPNVIFGNMTKPLTLQENMTVSIGRFYKVLKDQGFKYGGIYSFHRPILLVFDEDLLKSILIKDFEIFGERGVYADPENDPLSGNLFGLDHARWRVLRQKLSPTFTSAKLKTMSGIMDKQSDNLVEIIGEKLGTDLDIYCLFEKNGIDIIGEIAFGITCNTLRNKNNDFYSMVKRIFKAKPIHMVQLLLTKGLSNPGNLMWLTTADKEVCTFFMNLVTEAVEYRKINNVKRNDFLQLLIDAQEDDKSNDRITLEQIAAQCFLFFAAAFETSAKTMLMCFYEMSKNMTVQDKLRDEIRRAVGSNGYGYDVIMNIKYLDLVIKETLRKSPPVTLYVRLCKKDYQFPDTNLALEKDTLIMVPVYAMQNDPDNFTDPDRFIPERFESDAGIKSFSYFPFGVGPRNCIGERFAMLQMKMTICKLMSKFEFKLSPKTKEPLTLVKVTENPLMTFEQTVYLNVTSSE